MEQPDALEAVFARRNARVLITGAAGAIGTSLRHALLPHCEVLRSADLQPIKPAAENEHAVAFDLRDFEATQAAMAGIDTVFHFGGIPAEDDWAAIRSVNIDGTYNVFEAARLANVRRVVFASSNHVCGFARRDVAIGTQVPYRPDSRYGVSKILGEAIGRLYADKHALEVICLRIGQFRPVPTDRRMLSLWLSPADMEELAICCLHASNIHFEVVYGISDNTRSWYEKTSFERVGYRPKHNAEDFASGLSEASGCEIAIAEQFQGGSFCAHEFDGCEVAID